MTNSNMMRVTPGFVAVAAALACGGNPTGRGLPPDPENPTIIASALAPGGEGVLTGVHLDKLAGTITVEGVAVTPMARSQSEIRFRMPLGRPCEVDGRPVAVQAGSLSHTGQLEVSGTLALQVGESRVLARDAMAEACLQFPAGNERYVLTALNPGLDPAPGSEVLFIVRSWTGADSSGPQPVAHLHDSGVRMHVHESPRQFLAAAAGIHRFSENPEPFDLRYRTAGVGDTLPWVDWWGRHPNCSAPRNLIPTINIVVAAVSASGKTVFAYDTRSRYRVWSSEPTRARLTRAAEIMEKWAVPAVRESMDRDYQPVKGGGGRWFHIFRTDVAAWSIDNNDAPQTACRYSSEVPSTVSPDSPPESDAQVEYIAGLLIHEYAHHAATVYRIRRWGSYSPPTQLSQRWVAAGEAWAQTVTETAARLASGQTTGARYAPLELPSSNIPFADFYLNGYGESSEQSLWSSTPGRRGGYYDQGTRFLMYLRERWGDAEIGSTKNRLFERAEELPHYDVPSLAALAGRTATDALDQWSLAEATDDLVEPGAATARGLPQIRSWSPHDTRPLPSLMLSRTVNSIRTLSASRGNFAALYLFADEGDAGKGVSLTFEGFGAPFVARITRLR